MLILSISLSFYSLILVFSSYLSHTQNPKMTLTHKNNKKQQPTITLTPQKTKTKQNKTKKQPKKTQKQKQQKQT